MSTPKAKPAKKETKVTKAATEETKVTPASKISFVCVRPNGKTGPKTDLLAMVPKKGTITYKAFAEKAETEGMQSAAILKFVKRLARDGHIELS